MDCIELIEIQKAMIGRGVDYETSELILNDFMLRMKRFKNQNVKQKVVEQTNI